MSLTIWLRLFGLSEKNGFCSWIALTNLSFLAQRMQQARVQMHPDADGTHTAEEARHDSVLEERRRRPPRQWLRHPRLRKGTKVHPGSPVLNIAFPLLWRRKWYLFLERMRTGGGSGRGVVLMKAVLCAFLFDWKKLQFYGARILLVGGQTVVNLVEVILFPSYNFNMECRSMDW